MTTIPTVGSLGWGSTLNSFLSVAHNDDGTLAGSSVQAAGAPYLTHVFNILQYGADPTGAADSTSAIQSAYAAASSAGGGYVYYPPGTFKQGNIQVPGVATAQLYINANVHFMFAGIGTTVVVPLAANTPLFSVNTGTHPTAAGVRFVGGFTIQAHASGSTGPAIDLTGARQFILEDVSYWDSAKGSSGSPGTYFNVIGLGNNSYANRIVNPVCEAQHIGNAFIGVPATTGIASNNNTIENPLFENNTSPYMIDAAGTSELNIYNGIIEGNTLTASIRLGYKTRVRGIHFEANAAYTMDAHSVDTTDPGICYLDNNHYNSGSGTLTIPANTSGYNQFIGPIGSLTVVDNAPTASIFTQGAQMWSRNANGSLLYLPQSGIQLGTYVVPTTTGTVTLSMANGTYQRIIMTGNITLASIGNAADGQELVVELQQPASGGPYTVTWNAQFAFGARTPVMRTQASALGHYVFRYSSALSKWVCNGRDDGGGMPQTLNVVAFGADPTGVADSTAAIQAAINLSTGSAAPSSTSRVPQYSIYIPPGTFKVSADLLIQSTQGFNFFGEGPEISILMASGTGFTTAVLNIDGSYAGRYHGFTIKGDGTEQVTNAINLTWTTGASRSTTGNKFGDMRIRNLNFVTGFSMAGITNRQVDSTRIDCVVINGSQTVNAWSNSGNWQKGFEFGNGTFANIYDQVLTRCEASNVYYGFYNNVSSFSLNGSQPANNFCDFYINPGAQSTITNVQSQNSGQLLISPSNFSPQPTSFNDVQVKTSYLSGTNSAVITIAGGFWNFNNISAPNLQANTTVASGSNGGEISAIASWSFPSAGILDVTNVGNIPTSGTVTVATSTTTATVAYTGVAGGQLTGCTYVSGSATGLVATGGAVSPGYVNGAISLTGASSSRPCVALFNNLQMRGVRTSNFVISNSVVQVNGYSNYEPTTGNTTYGSGDVASLWVGGVWTSVGGPGAPPDIQFYTAAGNSTWTKLTGAQTVDATIVAGGGGGGSGALNVAGVNAGGGGGGGGGGFSRQQFQASQLASSVTVTVGAGGNGGAAVTSTLAGNNGVVGGSSLFGSYMWAHGGGAGGGAAIANGSAAAGGLGGAGTGTGGNAGGGVTTVATAGAGSGNATGGGGAGGGVASTTVAAGSNGGTIANIATWTNPSAGVLSVTSSTGFLAGGGTATVNASGSTVAVITYTGISGNTLTGCAYVSGSPAGTVATNGVINTALNGGGTSATSLGPSGNVSAGGIVGGATPTTGSAPAIQGNTGPGGGGGAAALSGTAQSGASATTNSAAGGGGGGGCSGGTSSGAGGNGATGWALVITYFQ